MTATLEKIFPRTHPPSSKIIFLAHKSIPRKIPEKYEKVASSFCVKAISVDNQGIGAIIPLDLNNPGRYSTMNPKEVMYGDHKPRVSEESGVFYSTLIIPMT